MPRRVRTALVLLAAVVSALGACAKSDGERAQANHPDSLPDETMNQFMTQETDSGRVQWTLKAPRASRFNSKNVFVMDDPHVEFYDEMGNLQTTLTAKNGEYSLATHDMLAYGDVVAVTTKGEILETDSLKYMNETDKIVSDSYVKLTRGRDVLTGIGLECDHTLSSVDIKKDVHAQIVEEVEEADGKQSE